MKGYSAGKEMGEMKDYQPPESQYAERFDQKPLEYISKRDRIQSKEASKVKSQMYKGRYQ